MDYYLENGMAENIFRTVSGIIRIFYEQLRLEARIEYQDASGRLHTGLDTPQQTSSEAEDVIHAIADALADEPLRNTFLSAAFPR